MQCHCNLDEYSVQNFCSNNLFIEDLMKVGKKFHSLLWLLSISLTVRSP